MRNLDLVNDVVPPVAVTAVQIMAAKATTPAFGTFTWQQVANYAMTGGGYLAAAMGWGGRYNDFIKNVAIASAPATLLSLYNKVATPVSVSSVSRVARRVSRYPGPASETPFQGVRLV